MLGLGIVLGLFLSGHGHAGHALLVTISAWVLYGTLAPNARTLGPITTRCPKDEGGENRIWITIDDGPDPETTPRLLELLDAAGVKATFFLIGERAQAHPGIVREIEARGHGIGNHTHTHPARSFWIAGPWRTAREIDRCQEVLAGILKAPPRWFRAPVGHSNLFTHPAIKPHGLQLLGWSARGFDGVGRPVEEILADLQPDLKPGAIVLLHDAREHSVEVLERVLAWTNSG